MGNRRERTGWAAERRATHAVRFPGRPGWFGWHDGVEDRVLVTATRDSVAVVVVTHNDLDHLGACLRSIEVQSNVVEVVVVDNGSTSGSPRITAPAPFPVRVIANSVNVGVSRARNQGADATSAGVIMFVDPDTVLEAGCTERLAAALASTPGVAGPAVLSQASGSVEYGYTVDFVGFPLPLGASRPPLFIPGCAFATSRDWWQRLGGFDSRFFWSCEDLDYCWRVLLSGGSVQCVAAARAVHAGGSSAAGGYLRGERHETTAFRLVHRERNTLAVLLKCLSARELPAHVGATLLASLAVCVVTVASGRPYVASDILRGIAWNMTSLRETMALRRSMPRSRAGERRVAARRTRGFHALTRVVKHGLPRFVDPR